MEQHLFNGDSKDVLKTIQDNSVDLLASDPPYAISFMGKEWDKALPDKEIWEECYRVLKPGAFIAVMFIINIHLWIVDNGIDNVIIKIYMFCLSHS